MESYNYTLRQGSKKDICPNCKKRTFTPYVDVEGNIISDIVGYCDRRDKCKYHYTPKQYFSDHSIINQNQNNYEKRKNQKNMEVIKPSFIEPSDMVRSIGHYNDNALVRFLYNKFGSKLERKEIDSALNEYGVGTSKQFGGSPIFWLIDQNGNIRDGKIMGYDSESGKRIKEPRPLFTNVHTLLKDKYRGLFKPCFFGSHLTNIPDKRNLPLWLFESEKAALIVYLVMIWGKGIISIPLASAGCAAFNPDAEKKKDIYDRIRVLKNRKVVLFPDEGKFDEWKLKGLALKDYSQEVYISTVMERELHHAEIKCQIQEGDGFDDLVLRYMEKDEDVFDLLLTSYGFIGSYRLV